MEPIRLLRERGIEPTIYYSNSNIAPLDEYKHRLSTIKDWTQSEAVQFIEGEYNPNAWIERAGVYGDAPTGSKKREDRCRECYRQRFEASAEYASENGFDALGTTLSVSPYQYIDIIREELERACAQFELTPFFEDYSPQYSEATRRSRKEGLYRQNYCGCAYSYQEAKRERAERKAARDAIKTERALKRQAAEKVEQAKREERAAYDAERARRRAILKEIRENSKQPKDKTQD